VKTYFSSESVAEGHPDKICDAISDAILDACLEQDPESRVDADTFVTVDLCICAGQVTTKAKVNYEAVARKKIREIGYTNPKLGFSDKSKVQVLIHKQVPDIAQGVNVGEGDFKEQGAGDSGIMFGYACNETRQLMPLPITLAHDLNKKLAEVRKNGGIREALPDGKSQVTIEYEDWVPKRADTIVVAMQHTDCDVEQLRAQVLEKVIKPVAGKWIDSKTKIFINGTGKFITGGPAADTGFTGRQIMDDSYGGMGRHGGGPYCGKDPSKVDRSAAYVARYIAKNIVAAGLADRCEIGLSYCIGFSEPLHIFVECFGTNKVPQETIEKLVRKNFPLKPAEVIRALDLKKAIYSKTSVCGHFGKEDQGLAWEKTDKAEALKKQAHSEKNRI
jgi:S-adenosylmethionine synthetase